MKIYQGIGVRKDLVAVVAIGMLLLLNTACVIQPTTTYIPTSWPKSEIDKGIEMVKGQLIPSCIDVDRMWAMTTTYPEFNYLKLIWASRRNDFFDIIKSAATDAKVLCNAKKEYDFDEMWKRITVHILEKDHEGLITKAVPMDQMQARLVCALGIGKQNPVVDFSGDSLEVCLSGNKEKLAISIEDPAHFALSAREAPSEQEPGGVFARLQERAQAAVIEYAKTSSLTKEQGQGGKPEDKSVESLLKLLSPPQEPELLETQRVEFTVSSVLNSASVDDRLNYLSAYLFVPPFPGPPHMRISLEWELLKRFQAIMAGRPNEKRLKYAPQDFRLILDEMRVRVEFLEKLETEAKSLDLGTLKSTSKLDVEAGATAAESIKIIKIAPGISSERTENIKPELDKRSVWIDENRSLVRVTQRGRAEANISGTITSVLTLKIPKTSLYEIGLEDKKGLRLIPIEQSLFKEVDALGVVLGTIRVGLPEPMFIISKREYDGIAYTHIERPVALRLKKFKLPKFALQLQDFDSAFMPSRKGNADGEAILSLLSSEPLTRQAALFKNSESMRGFVDAVLVSEKLMLKKHPAKNWYLVVPCKDNRAHPHEYEIAPGDELPRPDKFWIGFGDEMNLLGKPFAPLPPMIGRCP